MTTTHEPPAAAVARDAHWRTKMDRLRARRLPERAVSLCDNDDAKRAVSEATLSLVKARSDARAAATVAGIPETEQDAWLESQPQVVIAQSLLATAEHALAEATFTLTFRALPRPAWEQLLREHAPSEDQADKGMEYDVNTFPAALIAACHVERDETGAEVDGMSVQDAQELLDEWSDTDAKVLFTAALLPNQTIRADLGKGS
ncbi:hypothetical protein [Kitasatospora sp. MBT63]|uniref:hypothetical protein n=1 Tax=Kitasatospora sp. MBT63 TaxID=1444768 RepID=UPI00053ADABA|nr:hypothetical protein [Kitasatospora sp. MBT63]